MRIFRVGFFRIAFGILSIFRRFRAFIRLLRGVFYRFGNFFAFARGAFCAVNVFYHLSAALSVVPAVRRGAVIAAVRIISVAAAARSAYDCRNDFQRKHHGQYRDQPNHIPQSGLFDIPCHRNGLFRPVFPLIVIGILQQYCNGISALFGCAYDEFAVLQLKLQARGNAADHHDRLIEPFYHRRLHFAVIHGVSAHDGNLNGLFLDREGLRQRFGGTVVFAAVRDCLHPIRTRIHGNCRSIVTVFAVGINKSDFAELCGSFRVEFIAVNASAFEFHFGNGIFRPRHRKAKLDLLNAVICPTVIECIGKRQDDIRRSHADTSFVLNDFIQIGFGNKCGKRIARISF